MTGGHDGPRDVPALTGVRAIAAWWVVVYHIRSAFAPWAPGEVMAVLAKGYLAVDMFFVLSGFVIYLNYRHRIEANAASIADFMVRRIARIYPLHLLLLLATLAYVLAALYANGSVPQTYAFELLPLNLLLVQNWGFTDQLSWNIPSWSISTELFAYILFPAIALGIRWHRWPTWGLWLAAGGLAITLHLYFLAHGAGELGDDIPGLGLVRCVMQFMIGTALCALFLRLRAQPPLPLALVGAAIVIGAGVAIFGWVETLAMPLLWITLILGIALWPGHWANPLAWRPLVYLGDISYSTYLVHYLAFIAFKLLFVEDLNAMPLWLAPAFLVAVLVLSVLLYRGFERPAQRWILDQWKSRRATRPRAPAPIDAAKIDSVGQVRS